MKIGPYGSHLNPFLDLIGNRISGYFSKVRKKSVWNLNKITTYFWQKLLFLWVSRIFCKTKSALELTFFLRQSLTFPERVWLNYDSTCPKANQMTLCNLLDWNKGVPLPLSTLVYVLVQKCSFPVVFFIYQLNCWTFL